MVNYKRNQGKPQKPKACRGITIRRKEKLMKKLTALFLSLAMIFATISLTAVPVSAASNSKFGNNELTVLYEDYIINVYHKSEKVSWCKFNSIVTFEVITPYETVRKSKTVTNYFSALSFEKTCSKNKEIKTIIETLEDISYYIACDQIVKDMSQDFSAEDIKNCSIGQLKKTIDTYVEKYPAENVVIDQLRSVSEVLDKAFYIKDLKDAIEEGCGIAQGWKTWILDIISVFGNQANKALGLPSTSHYHNKIVIEIRYDLISKIQLLK